MHRVDDVAIACGSRTGPVRLSSPPCAGVIWGTSVNFIDHTIAKVRDEAETQEIVATWLGAFEKALAGGDETVLASLLDDECNWRDVLAFTWHLTAHVGAEEIAKNLVVRQPAVSAHGFKISANWTPARSLDLQK